MKTLLTFALTFMQVAIFAQNPIIQTVFTADPAPMVHNDTLFLYTTHDEDDADNFKMRDWLLFTSTDMVNWNDCGVVASLKNFEWYNGDNGAWAMHTVERDGKFYMYCPIHGHGIGVLVADSPYGPFKDPLGKPLVWQKEHWYDIDPTVFIDSDNQAYMYWGNPKLYCVKLNSDMISYSGEIMEMPHIEDYQEGPWFYKHNGLYYLAFASTCCPEGIGYAMSNNPLGKWEYKGHIMNHTDKTRGNHPGIVDYKGKSYCFGLNYDILKLKFEKDSLPFKHSERRSVSVVEITYNNDGTINESPYFKETVLKQTEPFNPFRTVSASVSAWAYGMKVVKNSDNVSVLTKIDNNDELIIKGADFGKKGASKFIATAQNITTGSAISIFADDVFIGKALFGSDEKAVCSLKKVKGIHDIKFVFSGKNNHDLFDLINWKLE